MSDNAYEPLLSSDETEALLQAMRGSEESKTSAKEVELGSPEQRLRKSLTKADDVATDWAAEVRKVVRRMLGASALVREASCDVVPYSVVAQSVVPGSTVCVVQTPDGAAGGFLVAGPGLTTFVLNRRLGGGAIAQASAGDDVRGFLSAVDRRIVRPFCDEVISGFVSAWGPSEVSLAVSEVLSRPSDMPRLGQFEPFLRVPLSVSLNPESSEELSLLLGGSAIRAPKVEAPQKAVDPATVGDKSRMVARISHAELELVAVLGHAQSTVRNVLQLRVGDVVRLHEAPDSPLQIFVEGQKKMIGVPVVSRGNIAVEVTHVLKGAL